jgi:uncharacterized protein (TIGR02466 family)
MDIKFFNPIAIAKVYVPADVLSKINQLSVDLFKTSATSIDYPYSDLTLRGGEQRRVLPSAEDRQWLSEWIEQHALEYYTQSQEYAKLTPKLANCWTITQPANSYQVTHTHPNGDISGNLYLEVPDLNPNSAETDCCISFQFGQSPNPSHVQFAHIKPAVGMMLIFPSWLPHQVYPWQGTGTRRVLAWDCKLG